MCGLVHFKPSPPSISLPLPPPHANLKPNSKGLLSLVATVENCLYGTDIAYIILKTLSSTNDATETHPQETCNTTL